MSNRTSNEDDVKLFYDSPNAPLNENKNNEEGEEKKFNIKLASIILIILLILIIIALILIILKGKKDDNEKKWNKNLIIAKYENKIENSSINFFNNKYNNVSEFIDTMKLNGELINNTRTYIFNSTGIFTLEINFKYSLVNMNEMFRYCKDLVEIDLTELNTGNVETMEDIFSDCYNLRYVNTKNLYTPKLKSISGMFSGCSSLISIDLSSIKAKELEDISRLFEKCENLVDININNNFVSLNIINMYFTFSRCTSLTSINLNNFRTPNVKNMYGLFYLCSSLKELYIK